MNEKEEYWATKFKGKVIAVDFDGTIADYREGWKGEGVYGEVIPKAKESLIALRKSGCLIRIFTSRGEKEKNKIAEYLIENEIIFDEIICDKPYYDYIIDDRGLRFEGDWTKMAGRVLFEHQWDSNKSLILDDVRRKLFREYQKLK